MNHSSSHGYGTGTMALRYGRHYALAEPVVNPYQSGSWHEHHKNNLRTRLLLLALEKRNQGNTRHLDDLKTKKQTNDVNETQADCNKGDSMNITNLLQDPQALSQSPLDLP